MTIDIILLILVALACFKGLARGLIVAFFSFFAIIIGLAAAIKFSVVVAKWLQNSTNLNKQWLPFLSFLIVIIAVVLLVHWVAKLLQKAVESVMMGWINRLGGVVLYVLLYLAMYSIVLFYATEMGLLKAAPIQSSKSYGLIEPFGPKIIDALGRLLPTFKNLFSDLENFFGSFVHKK